MIDPLRNPVPDMSYQCGNFDMGGDRVDGGGGRGHGPPPGKLQVVIYFQAVN